jgi:hypothetical protein
MNILRGVDDITADGGGYSFGVFDYPLVDCAVGYIDAVAAVQMVTYLPQGQPVEV